MKPRPSRETTISRQAQADRVLAALRRQIAQPRCELDHQNPWQLLVATILSARTTDRTVNKVTPALFARFPTPAALADAAPAEVEKLIRTTGFFRSKARAIQETARLLVERHQGEVPRDMEALCRLRGVARKTANVVLGTAFGIPAGITVDVHAARVSRRLGLTSQEDPVKIEADLLALFPRNEWIDLGHRLVLHGRYTCLARGPRCGTCECRSFCPSAEPGRPPKRPKGRAQKKRPTVSGRASGARRGT
jgi:endonuclease-3